MKNRDSYLRHKNRGENVCTYRHQRLTTPRMYERGGKKGGTSKKGQADIWERRREMREKHRRKGVSVVIHLELNLASQRE